MNQQQSKSPERPPRNYLLAGCYFAAYSTELVFHDIRSFGVRYISSRAGGMAVVMVGWAMCHPYDDNTRLFQFLGVMVVLSIIAGLIAAIKEWLGKDNHTRYPGRPYLAYVLPLPELLITRWIEPAIALGVGWLIHRSDAPLGSYIMAAGFCQWVCVSLDYHAQRSRRLDVNDAIISQRHLVTSVRRLHRR